MFFPDKAVPNLSFQCLLSRRYSVKSRFFVMLSFQLLNLILTFLFLTLILEIYMYTIDNRREVGCPFRNYKIVDFRSLTKFMKFIQQFSIILFVSFLGEGLKLLLPFPIPASVYGLVLMLAALQFHIIKLDQVRETSAFLIEIMPVMFIPAGVGLLNSWNVLKPICIPVILITLLTTIIVMTVTGQVTQIIIQKGKKEEKR